MQGNVRLPLFNPLTIGPHGIGTEQLEYLSPEDAMLQMEFEERNGKVSIRRHGNEKVRIFVSESSEGRQHLENFMGCTVGPTDGLVIVWVPRNTLATFRPHKG